MGSRLFQIVVIAPAAIHATTIAIPFALQRRLPKVVATHFTEGTPDSSGHLWTAVGENFVLGTGAWTLFGLLAWLRHDGSMGRRAAAGLALGVIVLLDLALLLGLVAANLDVGTWREATSLPYASAVAIGGGVLAMVFGAVAVSPRRRPIKEPDDLPDNPVVGLPATGRTVWIGRSRNPRYLLRTLAATCLMIVLMAVGMVWMVVPAVLALVSLAFWSGVTAVFDGRRLTVRGGLPLIPLRRIDLCQIETAEAVQIDPREWGWGWRFRSLRRHLVVVRRGEGLLLALRGGREFVVTVDDATEGAAEIRRALRCQASSRPQMTGVETIARPPVPER